MLSWRLGEAWRALSWAPDASRLERPAAAPAGGPAVAQAPRVMLQHQLCSTGSADHRREADMLQAVLLLLRHRDTAATCICAGQTWTELGTQLSEGAAGTAQVLF